MNQIGIRIIMAVSLSLLPVFCAAWGNQGHETVGAIADQLLEGSAAGAKVRSILKSDETLSSVAVWADCVKHPNLGYCKGDTSEHKDEWKTFLNQIGKANDTNYHFADIDITTSGYQFNQDQSEEDVVHGIREAIYVLQGGGTGPMNPNNLNMRQALWLLTHLVGDIHQPLHVGVIAIKGDPKATLGGNWLYPNDSSCLHSKWDDAYVVGAMKSSNAATPSDFAKNLISQHMSDPAIRDKSDVLGWPIQWATETMGVARDDALKDVTLGAPMTGTCGFGTHPGWSVTLPDNYTKASQNKAADQIWKAGVRLTEILKSIWPDPV